MKFYIITIFDVTSTQENPIKPVQIVVDSNSLSTAVTEHVDKTHYVMVASIDGKIGQYWVLFSLSMVPVPLDRCLHPVAVPNGDGTISYYPCGHCLTCRRSYHSKWRNRLISHFNSGKYTGVFITLTYSNEHLPLVNLNPEFPNEIYSITRTAYNRDGSYDRLDCTDLFFEDDYYKDYFYSLGLSSDDILTYPHFVKKKTYLTTQFDENPRFAICLRKDVQDFVKRLRTCLSRERALSKFDTSFSYFICSEYGPKTFRPHYHGLLFFRSQVVAQFCDSDYILSVWKKSDLRSDGERSECAKIINNPSGISSYVSKYVTCESRLPFVLENSIFAPFHLQSKRISIGSEAFELADVPDMLSKGSILNHFEYFDKQKNDFISVDAPYPSSAWRRCFPKFKFANLLDTKSFQRIFSRICSFESESDFPDYVKEVADRYGIGAVKRSVQSQRILVPDYSECKRILIDDKMWLWRCFSPIKRLSDFKLPMASTVSRETMSQHIFEILNHDSLSLDYFLFGIPENRCACKKIHRTFKEQSWASDPLTYCNDYLRFFSLVESSRIKSVYDYSSILLHDEIATEFDKTFIPVLYPSFWQSLPKNLDSFTQDGYDMADNVCFYRFGFNLCELYDSDNNLIDIPVNRSDEMYFQQYLQESRQRIAKHETSRLYKHISSNQK